MARGTMPNTTQPTGRIGLGCVTFGREIDESTSHAILDHALDAGIMLLDTAEAYGGGQAREARKRANGIDDIREATGELHSSELTLGRWFVSRGNRDRVILQTKMLPTLTKDRVLSSIDASLHRLRAERIDIFMFHAYDANTPLGESLEALQVAQRDGKIGAVGCSNFTAGQVREALNLSSRHGLPRLEVIQSNYNLVVREIERELLPLCRNESLAVQTYSPLGAGFLTGKYEPDATQLPRGSRFHVLPGHAGIYFEASKFELVRQLSELSARVGISAAKLAIAWVMKNKSVDCVLIGARNTGHIDQAIDAMKFEFNADWERELFPPIVEKFVTKETQHA